MQTRQYSCITWSLGVECGGTEHETSGLFGNIADEREAINPLSVWLDTIKLAYHRILWNFRLTQGTAALVCNAECQWPSTLTAKVSANQRGIEQGILWGVDIQLNGIMFTWILFTLCPESGGMTPQGGPGVTAGAIFQLLKYIVYRIPTLPCPARMSGLNYCWI